MEFHDVGGLCPFYGSKAQRPSKGPQRKPLDQRGNKHHKEDHIKHYSLIFPRHQRVGVLSTSLPKRIPIPRKIRRTGIPIFSLKRLKIMAIIKRIPKSKSIVATRTPCFKEI